MAMTEPMTPEEPEPTAPKADETWGWTSGSPEPGEPRRSSTSRDWLDQLQAMIENLAEQAGPVVREIGAKAAELAAVAGEKAGPIAHRAAEVTADAGVKIASRSRDLAVELRKDAAAARAGTATAEPESTNGHTPDSGEMPPS
jgi:hypothetical protein